MPTATDPALLLTQWLSPGFPVGAFAYSHGLEAAIGAEVTCAEDLHDWLADLLEHGTGWSDAILIRAAVKDPATAATEARARAISAERLTEAEDMGRAFCAQMRQVWGMELPDLPYQVAFGAAVGQMGLPLGMAVTLYLHAFAANLTAAAQRLMPLGQTRAQQILLDLAPLCQQLSDRSAGQGLDDIHSFCFAADCAALRHETHSSRLFRT